MKFDFSQKMKMVFNKKCEIDSKSYTFSKSTRYTIQGINFIYLLGGWVYLASFYEKYLVEYNLGVTSTILSLMTMIFINTFMLRMASVKEV